MVIILIITLPQEHQKILEFEDYGIFMFHIVATVIVAVVEKDVRQPVVQPVIHTILIALLVVIIQMATSSNHLPVMPVLVASINQTLVNPLV